MVRGLGEPMHDSDRSRLARLECVMALTGSVVAATVYEPNQWGVAYLCLNRWLLRGRRTEPVLLWARRELASGKRVSWLLADELDALP